MSEWTPEMKLAIYEDLRGHARRVWRELPTVDERHQSAWLVQQALRVTHPYVAAGADSATMILHFGLILGEMLRRTEVTEDVEIDLDQAKDPYG